ncbi:transcriptional regulator, AraC family (plasmid) [Ruegeria sp. TM1040]|uniref:AraC family transcriptional regulator n=1 Tax=Ruegeria sp. (strain TM1040) TaxID=292414 RepID=UPI0000462BF8|nr:AraC family transcriptional regulator [Ruegeria sp. TM1040]ABF62135.1 transcriptional regulator, AraC family [Ruegeria sp. TM1040]
MAQSYEDRILRVLRYIHDNPAGDLSLDRLADVAAMSRFHWHRVFRALTGETCGQSVRRIRLHRAAVALAHSDASIEEIAATVGYPSRHSFSRAFTAAYGDAPGAFRAKGLHLPPLALRDPKELSMHNVTLRDEPARHLVTVPHRGPYAEIGRAFEHFSALANSRNLWPQLGPVLGVYLDAPGEMPEDQLRSYAGAEYRGDGTPEGLEPFALPGGKAAVLTFKGPYAGLAAAYDSLFGGWLPQSGETPADQPCYEIYLNDPRATAPEELLTEIVLPLR